jgi:hypothetical protein
VPHILLVAITQSLDDTISDLRLKTPILLIEFANSLRIAATRTSTYFRRRQTLSVRHSIYGGIADDFGFSATGMGDDGDQFV